MKIGLLPLCRPTFDVALASQCLDRMISSLERSGCDILGPRVPLLDNGQATAAIARLQSEEIDRIVVLQLTFTDALAVAEAGRAFAAPISIWAIAEPRTGGRLRLNSFCGLNLASHSLGLAGREFSWLYSRQDETTEEMLQSLLSGPTKRHRPKLPASVAGNCASDCDRKPEPRYRIGRVGAHPDGFDTCKFDPAILRDRYGAVVSDFQLEDLFRLAGSITREEAAALYMSLEPHVTGFDALDHETTMKSLRLKAALERMRLEYRLDGFAIRCWPEVFTEYGGAVCGPASLLAGDGAPCACEADVYGALSQLTMQKLCDSPVFLADIVDFDVEDDTAVLWHCGQAPLSMRDPESEIRAAIHSNRRMPLLFEFPLRPGMATVMRISRSFGEEKVVLAKAEVLRRPLAFSGTAGVVRFERSAGEVMNDIIGTGLEHHFVLAYGDHRRALRGVAEELGLPVLEL